jgi:FMN-dependent NADH-azoreductase
MSHLLFIEANDSTHQKEGISSELNDAFLNAYRENHP